MRTRTCPSFGQLCTAIARCESTAARAADAASAKLRKNSSPRQSTSPPPWSDAARRISARCSASTTPYATPSRCRISVEPSMSVNRNVTGCATTRVYEQTGRTAAESAGSLEQRRYRCPAELGLERSPPPTSGLVAQCGRRDTRCVLHKGEGR